MNRRGHTNILAVDDLTDGDKFVNLVGGQIADYMHKEEFRRGVLDGFLPGVRAVFHQGACSDTTERNGQFMMDNNYRVTLELFEYCQSHKIPFIYASSASYFPPELRGYYLAGDGAQCDKDGCFWIMGRIDDVLNVSGHRLGTMEVESALVAHEMVAEAAVVGRPDATTGEAVVAFVVLKRSRPEGDEAVAIGKQLRDWVAKEIGPIAKPKEIRFGDNLPKTRSGKIMRRLLRVVAKGEVVTQDVSTLENPAILDQLSKPV